VVRGLSNDSVVRHSDALRAFPEVKLIGFTSAARETLTQTCRDHTKHAAIAGGGRMGGLALC
jgi:hypothetical protein